MRSKNTPIAYKPPAGLRAQLPTKVSNYFRHATKQGLVVYSGEHEAVIANPVSHAIIRNDGTSTFLGHSTDRETADRITEQGLALNAQYNNPDAPALFETAKMFAGPGERAADTRNVHTLAFRRDSGDHGESKGYKVVAELTMPNPGTSLNTDPFKGTALEQPDGVNLVAHSAGEDTGHGKPFSIPKERIRGIFNTETGEFTPNPHFVAVAAAVGQTAVNQQLG